jgi:hypothetical protein
MTSSRLGRSLSIAILSSSLFSRAARADVPTAACVEADTQAQKLRREEKLGATREQLRICTDPSCPALVRDDCAQRLDELDKVQPTLVFEVKDSQDRDITAVKVSLDGRLLVESVAGAAIPVEPGPHTFTFETAGEKPVTKEFVLREGDHARHEPILFGVRTKTAAPTAAPAQLYYVPHGRVQRTVGLLVGGVGVIGLGLGALFGELASSRWSAAMKVCPSSPTCTTGDYTQANQDRNNALTLAPVSTVAFIAGGVLAAGGIVVFATAPGGSWSDRPPLGLELTPGGVPGASGMTLRAWF